ncbi:hypothetical protein QN277_018994 [Acacia crassicarpa]|uniref:Uncharacterized protein n=1 Tax=Acacia crassicarpa TaxID=499986 RepID=A0AAE1KK93_9FABA|nr:hypothetical protein QN277_018994 [Acacia crassicarpa]
MLEAHAYASPMAVNVQLFANDSLPFADPRLYQSVVGSLQYLCNTRSNIAFTVNKLSQFLQEPTIKQWECVQRLLHYLNGTSTHGLLIQPVQQFNIQSYTDSDRGGISTKKNKDEEIQIIPENKRSTSGYCIYLGANPIMWVSRKQQVVSKSTTEVEYRSVADSIIDLMWILPLLKIMSIDVVKTPCIWCDNIGTAALASNPILHSKTKHVELDVHFIREKVATGIVTVGYVPSAYQMANVLTKPQVYSMFAFCRAKMNIMSQDEVHNGEAR